MKAAAIAGVAGALALIFGAAALVGSAFGPDRSARAADREAPHAEKEMEMDKGHAAEPAADPVRGLAVANRGLALQLADTELERGRASTLRFRIADADGRPVRDFAVEHEKRMHLIVVRRDGQGFQHLHPTMDATGTWSVPLTLKQAGAYRVFADFKHDERAQTLAADLVVDGSANYEPLPAPATTATTQPVPADELGRVDGYEVSLDEQSVRAGREAELRFTVRRGGKVVRTEPYLGAGGHLVALREGDLAYLHVHPGDEAAGDSVPFMTEFPSAGRYRLYLQFKHAGRVHTAEFTQQVAR
jgi:hypothetical protein